MHDWTSAALHIEIQTIRKSQVRTCICTVKDMEIGGRFHCRLAVFPTLAIPGFCC